MRLIVSMIALATLGTALPALAREPSPLPSAASKAQQRADKEKSPVPCQVPAEKRAENEAPRHFSNYGK
jgi:hypothetical protein